MGTAPVEEDGYLHSTYLPCCQGIIRPLLDLIILKLLFLREGEPDFLCETGAEKGCQETKNDNLSLSRGVYLYGL
jgi:hypothetical protein